MNVLFIGANLPRIMTQLHHVTDDKPGISRKRNGKHFSYFDVRGKKISNEKIIKRINALAIPPAYKEVWICPDDKGHIQATGIDARGRKQYRYHPDWRKQRDEDKFKHILKFGDKLPLIRKKVRKDLGAADLSKEKVLALIVQLLEKTLIRVGNEEYAQSNHSYGLTTLKDKHVQLHGADIRFRFKGKSGKEWDLSLHDKRIASIIKKCEEIPGYELFKFVDNNGRVHDIESGHVNAYLKDISGGDFTAKDFRTWSATVLAAWALAEYEKFDSEAQAKKNVVKAIESVAKRLGNTPAICRKSYIHPEIINAYLDGDLIKILKGEVKKVLHEKGHLTHEEITVLNLLRNRLTTVEHHA